MKKNLAVLLFFFGMDFLFPQAPLDFTESDFSGWKSYTHVNGTSAKSSATKVTLSNPTSYQFTYETPYFFYLDTLAYFEMDMNQPKPSAKYTSGISVHVGNFDYELLITNGGYWMVRAINSNNKEDSLMDWLKDSKIKTGANSSNTFGVECRNGVVTFYLNGEKKESVCNGKLMSQNPKPYTSGSAFHKQRSSIYRLGISVAPDATVEITRFASAAKPDKIRINLIENPVQGLKKENLGPMINTSCNELNPVVSADDGQIYFSIRTCDVSGTNSRKDDDLFYSTHDSASPWQHFKKLGYPFNNKEDNSMISISGDNNTIYFESSFSSGGATAWFSQRLSEGKWGPPQAFSVPAYTELNRYSGKTISCNRKVMISYLEEANSVGNTDLYVSLSEDGIHFTKPKNMGSTINTPLSEFGVFLAPDNKTLYFSSYGHGGYGNCDIFVTKRLDDTWTKWSKPQNLGPEINTNEWDAYFTIIASGKYAYMVSVTNGTGGSSDIVRIPLPQSAKPDPVVLVKGHVLDAKTKKPLYANVVSTLLRTNTQALVAHSDSAGGVYQIILPAGELYDFTATKGDYYANSIKIDVSGTTEYTVIEKDILLTPIEDDQTFTLKNISFVDCTDSIKMDSRSDLDRLAAFMKKDMGYDADLDLVIPKTGECPHEDKLADKRANAIKDYLISKGVDPKRIKHKIRHVEKPVEVIKKDSLVAIKTEKIIDTTITAQVPKIYDDPKPDTPQHMDIQFRLVKNKSHKHYRLRKQI